MAFSVSKSRPFRSLGLYRATGKHAAPKGWVPESHPESGTGADIVSESRAGRGAAKKNTSEGRAA